MFARKLEKSTKAATAGQTPMQMLFDAFLSVLSIFELIDSRYLDVIILLPIPFLGGFVLS